MLGGATSHRFGRGSWWRALGALPACAIAAACETGGSARRDSHRLQVGDTVYAVPASARPALDDGPVTSDDRVIVTQRFSFALTSPVPKPGGHSVHTIASPAIVSPDLRPGIASFAAAAVRRLAYSAIVIDRPNRSGEEMQALRDAERFSIQKDER